MSSRARKKGLMCSIYVVACAPEKAYVFIPRYPGLLYRDQQSDDVIACAPEKAYVVLCHNFNARFSTIAHFPWIQRWKIFHPIIYPKANPIANRNNFSWTTDCNDDDLLLAWLDHAKHLLAGRRAAKPIPIVLLFAAHVPRREPALLHLRSRRHRQDERRPPRPTASQ